MFAFLDRIFFKVPSYFTSKSPTWVRETGKSYKMWEHKAWGDELAWDGHKTTSLKEKKRICGFGYGYERGDRIIFRSGLGFLGHVLLTNVEYPKSDSPFCKDDYFTADIIHLGWLLGGDFYYENKKENGVRMWNLDNQIVPTKYFYGLSGETNEPIYNILGHIEHWKKTGQI